MYQKAVVLCFTVAAFFFVSSCATHATLQESKDTKRYYISESFDSEKQFLIRAAALHISTNIDCVNLERTSKLTDGVVHFMPMAKPAPDEKGKLRLVGLFNKGANTIRIAVNRFGNEDELTPTSNMFFLKVAIHEFAHFLGMQGSHAFSKELSKESQLTPNISDDSEPKLYKKDIEYLEKVVCGEEQ